MKITHKRDRYQAGSLTTETRSNGPHVWIYRWRETGNGGKSVQRKRVIGTKKEYPTETSARRAIDALQLDINAEVVSTSLLTIGQLAQHYKATELAIGKSAKTQETYKQHIRDYIVPRWANERISSISAHRVEEWLGPIDKAGGTKTKTKQVFSCLYQHAMRHGWADRNPIREVRQSAKRQREPDVLSPEELMALFRVVPGYARVMVVVAAITGLRRGELVGLKWADVDYANGKLYIRRSIVDQVAGDPKTEASRKPLPLESALAATLQQWNHETPYKEQEDWVFASPYALGKKPYWPQTVLEKIIRPAALKAGISKVIGWHTFRRTAATLYAQEESVKTAQELMRHATPATTFGLYAQGIESEKRGAQNRFTARLGMGGEEGAEAVPA